ncbi:endonuclease MutS2 [Beduinella massiliensis]|uniref:endonuclease MutS2 n=1 Tax=Beduinella massiliensis TaxID=1852363 RepID=UPI000C861262
MTERSLRVLEFTKIREQIKELTVSDMGREIAGALVPSANLSEIRYAQEETEEAHVLLTYLGEQPIVPFPDIRQTLKLAEIGATLSPRALLDAAACMRAARAARDVIVTDRENTPNLRAAASRLSTFRQLEEEITSAIISEEEISDHASPELADIRRHIRGCNERVREKLNSMIHSSAYQKYLQEPIITMRGDRFVIPVKQEYRANVPGLVHDQSATGATVFVEPMAVLEITSDLKQWQAREKAEIERILQALSARIAPESEAMQGNLDILARLDFAFAKAGLSRRMYGCAPKINEEGYVRIVRGRHPLIDPDKVVPSDIWLGKDFTTLVITGPNTGGKTVTLKTVGLFCLMAQAGLHVPAELGTEIAVFDDVFADIGDEQSIEQSLSTFSSHMKNIVSILGNVTERSLVLFDELGAGTDPTEGAALAQAILSKLLKRKIRTMATTHYSELKEYAMTTAGVENASVEFDVATLRPTYRLSIGIPGKSNAFDISKKLGLEEAIIEDAKQLLSGEQVRFEDVIANAEYHRQIAEKERQIAEEARAEMVAIRNQAERERERLERQRDEAIRKAKEQARRILEDARRESETLIAELRRMKKEGAGTPEHEIQRLKSRLNENIDAVSEALTQPVDRVSPPPRNLKPGDRVRIVHLGTEATVLAAPDAKGEVQLQAGVMKLKVHITQLQLPKAEPAGAQAQKKKGGVRSNVDIATRAVRQELDIRGMAVDEALPEVDKFLDDAMLSGLGEVNIIHGKGTGVLRAGVQDALRRNPRVKSYRLGVYGEGESGVTVVTLK